MGLSFEFFESAGDPVANGIFIPRSDLPGIAAGEFASATSTAIKESKLIFAIMNAMVANLGSSALGATIAKGNPAGTGTDIFTITYTYTNQYYLSFEDDSVGVLPAPITGTQVGVGEVAITDIFPNAVKVAAAASGAATGEGVVIPTSLIDVYGGPAHASITVGDDSRDYLAGLMLYLANKSDIRSTSVASAVTARTVNNLAAITLPATAFDATNPTTGLDSSKQDKYSYFSKTATLTVQALLNQSTQTFDVNVVTA